MRVDETVTGGGPCGALGPLHAANSTHAAATPADAESQLEHSRRRSTGTESYGSPMRAAIPRFHD
jgi:hypothetical protein